MFSELESSSTPYFIIGFILSIRSFNTLRNIYKSIWYMSKNTPEVKRRLSYVRSLKEVINYQNTYNNWCISIFFVNVYFFLLSTNIILKFISLFYFQWLHTNNYVHFDHCSADVTSLRGIKINYKNTKYFAIVSNIYYYQMEKLIMIDNQEKMSLFWFLRLKNEPSAKENLLLIE